MQYVGAYHEAFVDDAILLVAIKCLDIGQPYRLQDVPPVWVLLPDEYDME